MYDSGPPQVWLIIVWVFIGILVFLIANLVFFWKRIQKLMVRWMSKRRSVVVPMSHPVSSMSKVSLMRAFKANSLFQPTNSNKSRLSAPINPSHSVQDKHKEI